MFGSLQWPYRREPATSSAIYPEKGTGPFSKTDRENVSGERKETDGDSDPMCVRMHFLVVSRLAKSHSPCHTGHQNERKLKNILSVLQPIGTAAQ